MKALFIRFNRTHSKDKVKDPMDSDSFSPPASSYQKEKPPQFPPLREWPPPPPQLELPQRSIGTPTSITSYKHLAELSSRPLPPMEVTPVPFTDYFPISISHSRGPLADIPEEDSVDTTVGTRTASPHTDQDFAGRSTRKTGNGSITTTNGSNDVSERVLFLSPPPTPSGLNADGPLPEDASASNTSTVVRSQPSHPKEPRGSMSTAASGSRPDVDSSKNSTKTVKDTPTRSVTSAYSAKPAYGDGASIHNSLPSVTPFSQKSIGSVLPPAFWSEGAEEDLVTHLGPRERTRQEVLWEIVASEERYVTELLKIKDTFIVPLLHPYATSPVASPTMLEYDAMSRLDTPMESPKGMLRKSRKSLTKADLIVNGGIAPHQLPDDLRQCLEVIEDSILPGHLKLSECLRKRYDEQYPLVRSLADVVVANSQILRGYADYVLHLERAFEQANEVISTSNSMKRPKNKDADEWVKFCTFLRKLENDAQDRGETGLTVSLLKPFQRLLKYPLLFQNLLSHTDPSTFEYESALLMVAQVENIVRSIEDEIIQEERAKTRDILARIKGLDKAKPLATPKPSRFLVEERKLSDASVGIAKAERGKTLFKCIRDLLQNSGGGVGGKKDLWLVVFNDAVLRCQRTGTTSISLRSAHASRANSVPELQDKSKDATTGRRNSTARPRNLYKFIKIESWTITIGNSVQPREDVVSMEEDDDEDEDGRDDFDDDNKSKTSKGTSYWSADKMPIAKRRPGPGGPGTRRNGPIVPSGYSREPSANAKFSSRPAARPASCRSAASFGRRLG